MGTCGLVGQIGVYSGWVNDVAAGTKASITDGLGFGLILYHSVPLKVICPLINMFLKKLGLGKRWRYETSCINTEMRFNYADNYKKSYGQ